MLPDAQEVVCKEIFRGALACEVVQFWQTDMRQDCVFHIFDCVPEMVKAELVCKSWNAAYKDYVKAFFAEEDRKLRQTVIVNGLAMCGLTRYDTDHVGEVEEHTQEVHQVLFYKGYHEVVLCDAVLTHWKPEGEDVHTLAMEYGVRSLDEAPYNGESTEDKPFCPKVGMRLTQIPAVCFENPTELDADQRRELEQWREDFIEKTEEWLTLKGQQQPSLDEKTEEWLTLNGQQQPSLDEAITIAQYKEVYGAWHTVWLVKCKEQTDSE